MNFSNNKLAHLSTSVIFAIALSTATPLLAQPKSEPAAAQWPAEIAARQAIQTLPQHSAYLAVASKSADKAAGAIVTLAGNETSAQNVIAEAAYGAGNFFAQGSKRTTGRHEATLATNESAARAAISQTQALSTRELIETRAKRKITQAESATSSGVLFAHKP